VRVVWEIVWMPVASLMFIITVVMFYAKVEPSEMTCEWCYKFNGLIWNDTCFGEECL
jgi:hypothetical protein